MAVADCPSDLGGCFRLLWGSDMMLEHCRLLRLILLSLCTEALMPPRTLTLAQSLHPRSCRGPDLGGI